MIKQTFKGKNVYLQDQKRSSKHDIIRKTEFRFDLNYHDY